MNTAGLIHEHLTQGQLAQFESYWFCLSLLSFLQVWFHPTAHEELMLNWDSVFSVVSIWIIWLFVSYVSESDLFLDRCPVHGAPGSMTAGHGHRSADAENERMDEDFLCWEPFCKYQLSNILEILGQLDENVYIETIILVCCSCRLFWTNCRIKKKPLWLACVTTQWLRRLCGGTYPYLQFSICRTWLLIKTV